MAILIAPHSQVKVRCQSNSRYALVADYDGSDGRAPSAVVLKRSAAWATLKVEARRIRGRGFVSGRHLLVWDMRDGGTVEA